MAKRAVIAIINYDGKLLIGKKRSDSPKALAGKWHFPSETVEGDESDEEALINGMRRETELEIRVGSYITSTKTPSGRDAKYYECFSTTDRAIPGEDLEDVRWVSGSEAIRVFKERAMFPLPRDVVSYLERFG